jgi:hypothetical protein
MQYVPPKLERILATFGQCISYVDDGSIHACSNESVLLKPCDRVTVIALAATDDGGTDDQFSPGGKLKQSVENLCRRG